MLLAAMGIEWAIWLIVFKSYQVSAVLAILREWQIPEWLMIVWPAIGGIGLLYLPKPWRRNMHMAMCSFWVFVAIAIAFNKISFTAVPVYATIGVIHAGLYGLVTDAR